MDTTKRSDITELLLAECQKSIALWLLFHLLKILRRSF